MHCYNCEWTHRYNVTSDKRYPQWPGNPFSLIIMLEIVSNLIQGSHFVTHDVQNVSKKSRSVIRIIRRLDGSVDHDRNTFQSAKSQTGSLCSISDWALWWWPKVVPDIKGRLIKCNGNGTSGFYVLSNGTKHTGMNGESATFDLVYHLSCFKQRFVSQRINLFYGWIYWIKIHWGERQETQCDKICNLAKRFHVREGL